VLEELEQAAVALVNSADVVGIVDLGVGKQDETPPAAAGWAFKFTQVSVRTRSAGA
jgi:uncharacterized protein